MECLDVQQEPSLDMFRFGRRRGDPDKAWYVRDDNGKIVNRGVGEWREVDDEGRIWRGVDADGREIRTTEEEEEQRAIRKQIWQKAKFARELGFDPDTTDKDEIAAIDRKYNKMLQDVNEWNERERIKLDKILKEAKGE